jgi:hypothetical protein
MNAAMGQWGVHESHSHTTAGGCLGGRQDGGVAGSAAAGEIGIGRRPADAAPGVITATLLAVYAPPGVATPAVGRRLPQAAAAD